MALAAPPSRMLPTEKPAMDTRFKSSVALGALIALGLAGFLLGGSLIRFKEYVRVV